MKRYPKVIDAHQSIEFILQNKCSVSRYGDGEFLLMEGEAIGFQKYDKELSTRLKQILCHPIKNHIIGLPDVFKTRNKLKDSAKYFWKKHLDLHLYKWNDYVNKKQLFIDTNISRFYMDLADKSYSKRTLSLLKSIWDNQELLIVEGRSSRLGFYNDLFGNSKSVKRILCPAENAFSNYEEIYSSVLNHHNGELVLIALGPTATVLAYDLSKSNIWAIDLGHIDIEYEWFKMGATEKVSISNRYVNETNQRHIEEISDQKFLNQVIDII